jgi:nucleoid-associated protein YgaU
MGLIDFVRDAGQKLLGLGEAEAATAAPPSPEVLSKRAHALEESVQRLGLPAEDLKIKVAGDVAHVRAKVPSQEAREKLVLAIGNTSGIAQVNDDGVVVLTPEPENAFYTVQRGDTLSKIAKEKLGSAGKYAIIFEANKPMLKDPDRIYPGQVLRIPKA